MAGPAAALQSGAAGVGVVGRNSGGQGGAGSAGAGAGSRQRDALGRLLADLCRQGQDRRGTWRNSDEDPALLRAYVQAEARELSGEAFTRFLSDLYRRLAALLARCSKPPAHNSNPNATVARFFHGRLHLGSSSLTQPSSIDYATSCSTPSTSCSRISHLCAPPKGHAPPESSKQERPNLSCNSCACV